MKKELWYAVSGAGQASLFVGRPIRDEKRNVWLGEILPCYTITVMQLESEGFVLPDIKWKDEPVKIVLEIEIEK